jgi:hypothetical protein
MCHIHPRAENIKINGVFSPTISSNGVAKLTFNAIVDPDQLPLAFYEIAWGDRATTTVSGASLRGRLNPNNPFELYHYYDYWQLMAVTNRNDPKSRTHCEGETYQYTLTPDTRIDIDGDGQPNNTVPTGYCITQIHISLVDNWNKDKETESGWVIIKN